MPQVKVYTTAYCPYCVRAKSLLTNKGVPFDEINLEGKHQELLDLKEKTGMRTVPQIFVGDHFVGGFQELSAINQSGELDRLLTQD